jgi:hypothetical protein
LFRSGALWIAVGIVLLGGVLAYVATQWAAPTASWRELAATVRDAAVKVEHASDPRAAVKAINEVVPPGRTAIVDPANSAALEDGRTPEVPGRGVVIVADGVQARLSQLAILDQPVAMAHEGGGGTWVAVTAAPASSRPSVVAAVVTVVTALATALAVLLHRLSRRPEAVAAEGLAHEPGPDPQVAELQAQRQRMVSEMAGLVAALPPEFEWQAERVLTAAGLQPIDADGAAFDARSHYAVGTEPTPDAGLGDTVARTLQRGWADGDRVIVPARVVVYVVSDRPGVLP